jgi:hypothetical protein
VTCRREYAACLFSEAEAILCAEGVTVQNFVLFIITAVEY